jgi:hypothetical protein
MALSQEIADESELAKMYITNSDLSDEYKKSLMRLLNITTTATNGITPEEKIQKMTEAIHLLAVSQITFISTVDRRILEINMRQCNDCKAMKMTNALEEKAKNEQIIEQYKKAHGIHDEDTTSNYGFLKSVFTKPYVYIFGAVAVFSPFASDIVKSILNFFAK